MFDRTVDPLFARPDLRSGETGFPVQWNETVTPVLRVSVCSIAGADRTLAASESVARVADRYVLTCIYTCTRNSRSLLLRNRRATRRPIRPY